MSKKIILLAGPTASGKSKLAIQLAKKLLVQNNIYIKDASSFYETPSWPNRNFPKFFNIVLKIKTEMSLMNLFKIAKIIEKKIGRKKTLKNHPRVCDIDIIDFNGINLTTELSGQKIETPHPKMHKRNFVIFPLYEVNKNWVHPKTNVNINDIINNINKLKKEKTKEIVLTGVNIGDFGKKGKEDFYFLLKEIDKIKNIRIRISSIEPNLLSNNIIDLVSKSRTIVPHFHIPLQSGNNKILKAMGRRYNKELYEDRVKKIKMIEPDACIGADVIVGYPGETEFEFNKTYDYIKHLNINYLHVFPYSERENTRAIKSQNKISTNIKNERSKMLRILSEKKKRFFYEKNLNTIKNVLFENDIKNDLMYGYTDNYIKVSSKYNKNLINKVVACKLKKINNNSIIDVKTIN